MRKQKRKMEKRYKTTHRRPDFKACDALGRIRGSPGYICGRKTQGNFIDFHRLNALHRKHERAPALGVVHARDVTCYYSGAARRVSVRSCTWDRLRVLSATTKGEIGPKRGGGECWRVQVQEWVSIKPDPDPSLAQLRRPLKCGNMNGSWSQEDSKSAESGHLAQATE